MKEFFVSSAIAALLSAPFTLNAAGHDPQADSGQESLFRIETKCVSAQPFGFGFEYTAYSREVGATLKDDAAAVAKTVGEAKKSVMGDDCRVEKTNPAGKVTILWG